MVGIFQAICDTSGTHKREAESDKKSSVETHVQVVPRTSETDKEDMGKRTRDSLAKHFKLSNYVVSSRTITFRF